MSSAGRPRRACRVHHGHPVADVLDHGEIVGDEDQREPVAGLHVLEQVQDLGLHRHVEGRDGHVADDQARLGGHGPGDRDALALPAGELVRSAVARRVGVDAHRVQQLADAGPPLPVVADLPDAQALGDDVGDLPAGVERGDRVLEDHLEPGPGAPELLTPERGDLRAVEDDPSTRGARELHHGPSQWCSSTAGLADQPERLAGKDVEADPRHRVHLLDRPGHRELDDELLDPEQGVVGGAQVRGSGTGHVSRPPSRPRPERPA